MRPLLASLSLLIFLSGCDSPRQWYIDPQKPPTVSADGKRAVVFELIKERNDYLRTVFSLRNDSDQRLHFGPVDSKTEAWGVVLKPTDGALVSRTLGPSESGIIIPPGGSARFDLLWTRPTANPGEWTWTIEIHGLVAGDTPLAPLIVPMPKDEPPASTMRDQNW